MSILAPESTSRADDPPGARGRGSARRSRLAPIGTARASTSPSSPSTPRRSKSASSPARMTRTRPSASPCRNAPATSGTATFLVWVRVRSTAIVSTARIVLRSVCASIQPSSSSTPTRGPFTGGSTTPARSMASIPAPDHAPTTNTAARAMMLPRCLAASSSIPRSTGEATHLHAFPGARPSSTRRTSKGSAVSFRRSCPNCAAPISGSRTRRPSRTCAISG